MRQVLTNRRFISFVVAATAVALTGVIPLASAAEDSVVAPEQPLVMAASHQAPSAITEQAVVPSQPAVAPSELPIVLASDLRLPHFAKHWRVWAEPSARPPRKAVRVVRTKPRPAAPIVRVAYRFDAGPRGRSFVGVGFGF